MPLTTVTDPSHAPSFSPHITTHTTCSPHTLTHTHSSPSLCTSSNTQGVALIPVSAFYTPEHSHLSGMMVRFCFGKVRPACMCGTSPCICCLICRHVNNFTLSFESRFNRIQSGVSTLNAHCFCSGSTPRTSSANSICRKMCTFDSLAEGTEQQQCG